MVTVSNGLMNLAGFLATPAVASVLGPLQEAWTRLIALVQSWITDLNIPLLKYYSYLIETKLRSAAHQLLSAHLTWVFIVVLLAAGAAALWLAWRVLGSGLYVHKDAYRQIEKTAEPFGTVFRAATASYFKAAADLAFEGLLLVSAATVLTVAVYVLCKLAWYSYLVTPVGMFYPYYFPERAQIMNTVMGQDLFLFPMILIGAALALGTLSGAACRLLHITRYLYESRSIGGRIFLFALPLTLVTAVFVQAAFGILHWGAAFGTALLPTVLVFSFCFKATGFLLPEIGMVSSLWKSDRQAPPQVLFLRNHNSAGATLEFDPLQARLTGGRFPADEDAAIQGQVATRNGHRFILYRYGHDLFFQVDDLELRLGREMSVQLTHKGRFAHRFELTGNETCLFRLSWSALPMVGSGQATTAFFEAFQTIMQDRGAFEIAYTDQWDWEAEE